MEPIAVLKGSSGLNNLVNPFDLAAGNSGVAALISCVNVYVDEGKRINRCAGKVLHESLPGVHSISSIPEGLVYVVDSVLYYPSGNAALTTNNSMSYAKIQHKLFFTNGTDVGYITAAGAVFNPNGGYTGPATARTLITWLPTCDGIVYGAGRLICVDNEQLWLSEPKNPLLFDLARGRMQYTSKVTFVAPFAAGMWVSDEMGIYYATHRGHWKQEQKAGYPLLRGKGLRIDSAVLGIQGVFGYGYLACSDRGICLLNDNGIFMNLTGGYLDLSGLSLSAFAGCEKNNLFIFNLTGADTIGLIYNARINAVTQQTVYNASSFAEYGGHYYATFTAGIYKLFEQEDELSAISNFEIAFSSERTSRLRAVRFHGEFHGVFDCEVSVDSGDFTVFPVSLRNEDAQHEVKVIISRSVGIGTYWKVCFNNTTAKFFSVNKIEITPIYNRRIY